MSARFLLLLIGAASAACGESPVAQRLGDIPETPPKEQWAGITAAAVDAALQDQDLERLRVDQAVRLRLRALACLVLVERRTPGTTATMARRAREQQVLLQKPPAAERPPSDQGIGHGPWVRPFNPRHPFDYLQGAESLPPADAGERAVLWGWVALATRPYPKFADTPLAGTDQATVAVVLRRLLNAEADADIDALVLGELGKQPLLAIHRRWCLEHVARRRLAGAIALIAEGWQAWETSEATAWGWDASTTIAKIGGDQALQVIQRWSADASPEVRRAAIAGLQVLGGATERARLAVMADADADAGIRDQARVALGILKGLDENR